MGKKEDKAARAARARALLEGAGEDCPSRAATEPTPAMTKMGAKAEQPERFVPDLIPPEKWPKKYPSPNDIKIGDSVWYSGERYYVDYVPSHWSLTCFIRLCSRPVRPGTPPPKDSFYFYAPADACDLAPVGKNQFVRQPTMADVARKERAKTGQRDVGDEVAELLRSANTIDELYPIASGFLGVPEADLWQKYGHLNPGQQRMNLGNKMRFKQKKGR